MFTAPQLQPHTFAGLLPTRTALCCIKDDAKSLKETTDTIAHARD